MIESRIILPTPVLRHLHTLKQRGILQAYRSYHNTP